jgi:hypothetical protein
VSFLNRYGRRREVEEGSFRVLKKSHLSWLRESPTWIGTDSGVEWSAVQCTGKEIKKGAKTELEQFSSV